MQNLDEENTTILDEENNLENTQFIRINYDINTSDNNDNIINTLRSNIINNFNSRINNLFNNRNIDPNFIDTIRNSILNSIDLTNNIINETEQNRQNREIGEREEQEEESINEYINENNVETNNETILPDDINDINSYIDSINYINNINNDSYYDDDQLDYEYNNNNINININNNENENEYQDIIDLRNNNEFLTHNHNNNLYFTNYLNIVRNNITNLNTTTTNRNQSTIIYNVESLLLLRDSNTELDDALEYEMLLNLTNMIGKVDVGIKDIEKAAPIITLEELNDNSNSNICVICQDNFQKPIRKTLCNHLYCSICLEEWFKKNNKCPICMIRLNDIIDTN